MPVKRLRKPPIDREGATDLPPGVTRVPDEPVTDVPLDVVENQQPYNFVPKPGIGNLDLMEIVLTLVVQATGGSISGQGILRTIAMRPDLYETLSPEAQRFMVQKSKDPSNG